MVASIMQQWFRFTMCTLLQKHEEEQRLVELQRQLQELERAEHKLTTEAEELGLDAAEVSSKITLY